MYTGNIAPLGSEKVYQIRNGNLVGSYVNNYCKKTIWGNESVKYRTLKKKEETITVSEVTLGSSLFEDIKTTVTNRLYISSLIREFILDKKVSYVEDEELYTMTLNLVKEDLTEFYNLIKRQTNILLFKASKTKKEKEILEDLKEVMSQITIIFENEKD